MDPSAATSNEFEMEWPPGSGLTRSFPEIDRVAWFGLPAARRAIKPAQESFVDRLERALSGPGEAHESVAGDRLPFPLVAAPGSGRIDMDCPRIC